MARAVPVLLALAALSVGCVPSQPAPAPVAGPSGDVELACAELARAGTWRGAATADADGTVAVDADDRGFAPTCIRSPAGGLTVVVTNRGRLPHTFSVPALLIARTVDAGQTVFIEIPPLDGPLRVVCDYHVEEKMFAAIVPDSHA